MDCATVEIDKDVPGNLAHERLYLEDCAPYKMSSGIKKYYRINFFQMLPLFLTIRGKQRAVMKKMMILSISMPPLINSNRLYLSVYPLTAGILNKCCPNIKELCCYDRSRSFLYLFYPVNIHISLSCDIHRHIPGLPVGIQFKYRIDKPVPVP